MRDGKTRSFETMSKRSLPGGEQADEPGGDGFWDKVGELLGSTGVDYEWLAPELPAAQPFLQPVEGGPDRCLAAARQSGILESFPSGAPPVCTALLLSACRSRRSRLRLPSSDTAMGRFPAFPLLCDLFIICPFSS